MADGDLRAKYDELVRRRESRYQAVMEARANRQALQGRLDEINNDLRTLGVTDPTQLDQIIVDLESAIGTQLVDIERELNEIEAGVVAPTPSNPTGPAATVDVDHLLANTNR